MAKKKTSSRATLRKTARKRRAVAKSGKIKFTKSSIVINLDAAAQRQIKDCLSKSGKITFSVKEHIVTKLPAVLDNGKLID